MAAESAPVPPINGVYNAQYGQVTEPTGAVANPQLTGQPSSANSQGSNSAPKADPQEIGWFFVEQYYTTLSKTPDRIHLFYSKKSQFVVGVEAEKVLPAVGQKSINEKIKDLDIQDCKVRVLNVDSQASLSNIVVQVIGEMSNRSEPHRKFVQTFVLAEQPNGYFVLNDIFRYLSDEEDEYIEEEQPVEEVPAPKEPEAEATAAPQTETISHEPAASQEAIADEIDAKLDQEVAEEPESSAADNGDVNGKPADVAETKAGPFEEPAKSQVAEPAVPAPEEPREPEPTPSQSPPKPATPAPAAEAPPAKKTWANLVGSKAAPTPVVPAPATTPVPAAPKAPSKSPQPATPPTGPKEASVDQASQSNGWQTAGDHNKKQARPQKTSQAGQEQKTLAYIKNVNDKVDAALLRETLEKYGELKYFDVSRPRNCAFVEFADTAGYNAAVAANPHQIGSEQIYVEERRPRPNAYGGSGTGYARGAGNTGRGRGGTDRPGSQGRGSYTKDGDRPGSGQGRGGFSKDAGRGGKGKVTPKGRGQAQAA